MTKWQKIEQAACNTVGYSEAENKESFKIGASVGFGTAEDMYQERIAELERQLDNLTAAAAGYVTDLKTISRIINQYNDEQ